MEKYEKEYQKNRIRDLHQNNPNGYGDYQNNQNGNNDYQNNQNGNNDYQNNQNGYGYGDYQNNQNWNGDYQTNERNNNDDYQSYKAMRTYKYFKTNLKKIDIFSKFFYKLRTVTLKVKNMIFF